MDAYRELQERLKKLGGKALSLYQGIVESVEGTTCTVVIDGLAIPDIRLRATTTEDDMELLIIPAVGSGVIVGSLTGGFEQLVILSIDRADQIILNGGHRGGLVLVHELTQRVNTLERDLNELKESLLAWIPTPQDGGISLKTKLAPWAGRKLILTQVRDLENPKIKQ